MMHCSLYKRKHEMQGNKLPENLSFLSNVDYFAIAVYREGKKEKHIIEFRPDSLKELVNKANQAENVKEENKSLQKDLDQAKKDYEDLKKEYQNIKKNYEQLLSNIEEDGDYEYKPRSDYKSTFQLFEQKSFTFITPCEGGSPGQGQKK